MSCRDVLSTLRVFNLQPMHSGEGCEKTVGHALFRVQGLRLQVQEQHTRDHSSNINNNSKKQY